MDSLCGKSKHLFEQIVPVSCRSKPCSPSYSIGLPPSGKYHIDLDPTSLVFRNQSIKGTLVASMADVDETLDFASRGKLRLKPTVVGLGQFNEAVQKLKRGEVAG